MNRPQPDAILARPRGRPLQKDFMQRLLRLAAGLALALGVSGAATAFSLPKLGTPAPPTAPQAQAQVGEWPQAHSNLPADPAIRHRAQEIDFAISVGDR